MSGIEIENKLDEDFVFYLGFVNSFIKHVREDDAKHRCEQWLQKLCGERCLGVERKKCRNIYLSQLLLCMQAGQLSTVFLLPLNEVDINNALQVFNLAEGVELTKPSWLEDNDVQPPPPGKHAKKGRTYLATRTLPDGQGAFAYVAVSLEDEEPKWIGGGEGIFDQRMEQKYKEEVPEYEMEKILARRKDPKQREKVITFYTVLLQNIEDELDEKISSSDNATINGLLEQLEQDLKDRGEFDPLRGLSVHKLRIEMLLILHDRIRARIDKVVKREELLDEIENKIMTKSFFNTSVLPEDKHQLPAAMWEQVINKAPAKKLIEKLKDNYPLSLIEKFLELLSNHKEEIAMRMQRRYENIAAQMKKELRREDAKGKKLVDEAQATCDNAIEICKAVKEQYDKKLSTEERNRQSTDVPKSEHSKLYDEMRAALYDTYKSVEDEASRGRAIAAEINVVTEQTELCLKYNEENIRKLEEGNMESMRNIKRLNAAIKNQEKRIQQVQETVEKGKVGQQFEVFF